MTFRRDINFPRGRRGTASLEAPETIADLLLWYDPSVQANVVQAGTGVSEFIPRVGPATAKAVQGTDARRPTYNTPGTFASGINTITFTRANLDNLFAASVPELSPLDSNGPFTIALVQDMPVDANTKGHFALSYAAEPSSWESLCVFTFAASKINVRYRDVGGLVAMATPLAVSGNSEWVLIDYDGADTIGLETNNQARVTQTGISATTAAVFDTLRLGQSDEFGNGDVELGDVLIYSRQLAPASDDRATLTAWLNSRL